MTTHADPDRDPSPTEPAGRTSDPPLDFPPAPWRVSGTMRLGLFPLADTVTTRQDLTRLTRRRLLIGTIRYLDGDLRYDLFMIASHARRRHRFGIYLHQVWVNSPSARQAATDLWGVPSRMAGFVWDRERVQITDVSGRSVALAMRPRIHARLPLPVPVSCFAEHEGQLLFSNVLAHTRAAPATMQILTWPDELPGLRRHTTALALELARFRMTIPAAHPVS